MINKIYSKVDGESVDNKQEFQDCLPCKITGGLTFGGLGAYLLREANTLNKVPAKAKTAVGLGVGGVVFISAGIYRLLV